jgi:zinc protease
VDSFRTLFVYNLGLDYYSKYIERVGSLDAAGVHAAARKHLIPERMLVVAVGDRQKIEGELMKLNLGAAEIRDTEGNVVK